MPGKRAISVRFYGPGKAVAPDFAESATSVVYEGKAVTVREP
jgi:alpha-D-xyloside xylohydrolase